MSPRRREDDTDDAGALSRDSRPAWKLLAFIGGILTATVTVVGADRVLATNAAKDVVESRVLPLEKRLDEHLAGSRAMREVMDRYVTEERAARKQMARKLDALCRATRTAECPLGDDP